METAFKSIYCCNMTYFQAKYDVQHRRRRFIGANIEKLIQQALINKNKNRNAYLKSKWGQFKDLLFLIHKYCFNMTACVMIFILNQAVTIKSVVRQNKTLLISSGCFSQCGNFSRISLNAFWLYYAMTYKTSLPFSN